MKRLQILYCMRRQPLLFFQLPFHDNKNNTHTIKVYHDSFVLSRPFLIFIFIRGHKLLSVANTIRMKRHTTNRLCAFLLICLFSCSCAPTSSSNKESLLTNSVEQLPMEQIEQIENIEKPDEVENERVPAPPKQQEEMVDGVWNLADVDVSQIATNRKLIAFSFDDAPSRSLENIFAVYADYNEKHPDAPAFCTLFFNSCRFDAQTPKLLAVAHALRVEFGNHTHSHYNLTTLDEAQLKEEIDKTDEQLYLIDGKKRHLLRAPFGEVNDFVKSVAPTPIINWTIDTLDWTGISEDAIYHSVFDNRFPGAIVLMHDGYTHTIDALKRLLPDLYNDGYQVVSVSQLAKMHNCTLKQGSVYIRARKQQQNDASTP